MSPVDACALACCVGKLRHGVDLARQQRVEARRVVVDVRDLERVDVGLALHPVVRVLREHALPAGRERLRHERARADRLLVVLGRLALGDDPRVVVGEVAREIRIGGLERDAHRQLVDGLQLAQLDAGDEGQRGARLARHLLDRPDHVLGAEGLAVVERDAGAELDLPDGGVLVVRPLERKPGLRVRSALTSTSGS